MSFVETFGVERLYYDSVWNVSTMIYSGSVVGCNTQGYRSSKGQFMNCPYNQIAVRLGFVKK